MIVILLVSDSDIMDDLITQESKSTANLSMLGR